MGDAGGPTDDGATIDPLERVPLGRTDVEINRMVFGTAPLASVFWNTAEEQATTAVRRGIDLGMRSFDTAPFYGLGECETRLGTALAETGPADVVVATKVGRLLTDAEPGKGEAVFDFGADAIHRSLESSLERLRRDHVDVVHVHDPDDHLDIALDEAVPTLVSLRESQVIGAVSVGTNTVETADLFLSRADLDAVMLAGRYTLLDQRASDLITQCVDRGVAFLAAGVFNSGVLARPVDGAWFDYSPASPETLERTRAIERVCTGHDIELRTAALWFPFTHPGVTAAVVGMAEATEVDENLDTVSQTVPDGLWDELAGEGLIHR